jgi:hypothetical protein
MQLSKLRPETESSLLMQVGAWPSPTPSLVLSLGRIAIHSIHLFLSFNCYFKGRSESCRPRLRVARIIGTLIPRTHSSWWRSSLGPQIVNSTQGDSWWNCRRPNLNRFDKLEPQRSAGVTPVIAERRLRMESHHDGDETKGRGPFIRSCRIKLRLERLLEASVWQARRTWPSRLPVQSHDRVHINSKVKVWRRQGLSEFLNPKSSSWGPGSASRRGSLRLITQRPGPAWLAVRVKFTWRVMIFKAWSVKGLD